MHGLPSWVARRNKRFSYCGIGLLFVCTLFLVECSGCNTSRYGISYDQRLPSIKQIHVLPTKIQFQSMHTGGMLEARPDIDKKVRPMLLKEIKKVTEEKGMAVTIAPTEISSTEAVQAIPQSLALIPVIEQSIRLHYYVHGKKRVFDYTIGETVKELSTNSGDAVLLVRLEGVVPTAGRIGLAVTAAVVGGLVGVHVKIPTDYAELSMMLMDAESGDVLWYKFVMLEANASKERPLRNLVKVCAKYMLEPRDK